YMSSAEAADTLANSVGLLTRELRDNKAAADEMEVLSEDDFRKANEQIIEMLRNIDSLEGQQGMLLSIAFEMRAAGNTPEEVVEHIKRLAATAGIEVPVELNVTDVGQFAHQIEAAQQAAERAMADWDPASDVDLTRTMKEELSRLSESAANLWQNDETAAWAQLLGETTAITADSADATNHLVDEMLRLSGVSGLSTTNAKDLGTALDEMTSSGSTASEEQKEMLRTIREAASAMEGGLTPANFALAASQYTAGLSAAELGDRINGQREAADGAVGATDDLAAGQEKGAASAEVFASALDQVAANASFARMDFDAGAAAAQAFGEAMERSSRMSARLGAGLQGGAALKGLGEALTGEKQIAEIRSRAAKETEKAASSVDRLGDAARRADPKLGALGIRLEALEAAGQAFRDSIDNSSMLDDQVSSALNLGDAYREFEKTHRRLPATLDMTAIAMGKLRPRQAEAVQNMLSLGKAARDYLGTLIEMGKSDAEVAGEAARMRGEYEAMLRQMGLNEDQVRQYIEAMGLLPEQVTTAIRVSGLEAASVRLNAYIDLLDGRIPPEIATSIVAQIESGDVEGAASRLADFARSNPALLEVGVDQDSVDKTEEQIADVKAKLAQLPSEIDPLKAMLGGYTDAQQAALEAVMQFG
ncbi:MAG: hypothetical protein GX868_05550, partial [Actinobacteria bacterium]|nr:hypothetical protein [Actinomycetota bacterium]